MAKHIGNEVDVARLPVEVGAERGAQLVWTQVFFQRRSLRSVLLDHQLYGAHRYAPVLQGEEEGVLVPRKRRHRLAHAQVILEYSGDFVRKVEDGLSAALARDHEAAYLKVQIVDVDTHQFADADACAEKERKDGQIAQAGVVVVALLMLRLLFAALHKIEQARDFVDLQTNDRLLTSFGHINQNRYIGVN